MVWALINPTIKLKSKDLQMFAPECFVLNNQNMFLKNLINWMVETLFILYTAKSLEHFVNQNICQNE